jgi:hypothetical protein
MKKEYIIGFMTAILVFGLYSYTDTNGKYIDHIPREVYNIPVKQKNVIVTKKYDYVRDLLKKGYVCEDVDIVGHSYSNSSTVKYYTMVKY